MAKNNRAFAIDDTIGTPDNLAAYARLLEAIDAPLGKALTQYLAPLAASQHVEISAILATLYAATAPADQLDPPAKKVRGTGGAV